MKGLKGLPIQHKKLRTGKQIKPSATPDPAALGVGSTQEAKIYMWLKRRKIPFAIQVNFDGGANAMGGQRADFVLSDYRKIIEILGPFHYTPGQRLRDERKWTNRRREGWDLETITADEVDLNLEARMNEIVGRLVV